MSSSEDLDRVADLIVAGAPLERFVPHKEALTEYYNKIRDDLVTKYDGNLQYSLEDDIFLGDLLSKTASLLFRLEDELGV